jgi:hypothetical protein
MNNSDQGSIWLWAVDRNKGEMRWKKQIAPEDGKVRKGNMSSPSPVTDGKTVWVMSGNGHVRAFDFAGKELWHRDFFKDYGSVALPNGAAAKLAIYFPQNDDLKDLKPVIDEALVKSGQSPAGEQR